MSRSSENARALYGERKRIERSLRCSGCSYELKGLESHANCPECGTPISTSVGDVDYDTKGYRRRRNRYIVACGSNVALLVLGFTIASTLRWQNDPFSRLMIEGALWIAWGLFVIGCIWLVRSEQARDSPAVLLMLFVQFVMGGYWVFSYGLIATP